MRNQEWNIPDLELVCATALESSTRLSDHRRYQRRLCNLHPSSRHCLHWESMSSNGSRLRRLQQSPESKLFRYNRKGGQ